MGSAVLYMVGFSLLRGLNPCFILILTTNASERYYVHLGTNQSQWEFPISAIAAPSEPPPHRAPDPALLGYQKQLIRFEQMKAKGMSLGAARPKVAIEKVSQNQKPVGNDDVDKVDEIEQYID